VDVLVAQLQAECQRIWSVILVGTPMIVRAFYPTASKSSIVRLDTDWMEQ